MTHEEEAIMPEQSTMHGYLNWAKQHHSLWVEEEMSRSEGQARPMATPAE